MEKEEIIKKILKLIEKRGVHAVEMNSIPTDAGISKSLLSLHFSSKTDVFTACIRYSLKEHEEIVKQICDSSESSLIKLMNVLRVSIEASTRYHPSFLFHIQKRFRGLYREVEDYVNVLYKERFAALLKQAKDEGYLLEELDVSFYCQLLYAHNWQLLENFNIYQPYTASQTVKHLLWANLRGVVKQQYVHLLN